MKNKYYAYFLPDGRKGITDSWTECEKLVSGKANARYRGFKTETEARSWLKAGAAYEVKIRPKLEPGIYFDAGTGRGRGVEVSVTDEVGNNLLLLALEKTKLNKFGKHLIRSKTATNNYGELLALKYALQIAEKKKVKHIFGDSKLILSFWSQGFVKEKVSPQTQKLAEEVRIYRRKFETQGGKVGFISGDWNPADLGFH